MEKDNSHQQGMVRMLFIGSPLLDMTVPCESEDLLRVNLREGECVKELPIHDAVFTTALMDSRTRYTAGGSAQNSARVAKWVLAEKGDVAFAGCTGPDDFEQMMRLKLMSEKVHPLYLLVSDGSTGACVCLVTPGGQRTMCTRHGASGRFDVWRLNESRVAERLRNDQCVFVVGYFLVHSPNVVEELANRCLPHQMFSLSLSAEYVCREHALVIVRVLPRVDVLFGNEDEVVALVEAITQQKAQTVENALRVLRGLDSTGSARPRIVVVSRGSNPVLVDAGAGNLLTFEVPQNVAVVDTVGCGDALAGAFLATYQLTSDISKAAKVAIDAAVRIAQVTGCEIQPDSAILEH